MTRRTDKAKADQAFHKWIRERDQTCQICHSAPAEQCAHVWSRAYLGVRYDPRNAVGACASCHMNMTHHPLEWQIWVERHIPEWKHLRWLAVNHRTQDGTPANKLDYKAIAAEYGDSLADIKGSQT